MASAQVLPNSAASSRKLEHREAGRKALEEFRKKKAAKKAASVAQPLPADTHSNQTPSQNSSSLVNRPALRANSTAKSSGIHEDGAVDSDRNGSSSNGGMAMSARHWNSNPGDALEVAFNGGSGSPSVLPNGYHDGWREKVEVSPSKGHNFASVDVVEKDQLVVSRSNVNEDIKPPSFPSSDQVLLAGSRNSSTTYSHIPDPFSSPFKSILFEKSGSDFVQDISRTNSTLSHTSGFEVGSALKVEHSTNGSSLDYYSSAREEKIPHAINGHLNADTGPWPASLALSTDRSTTLKSSSDQVSFYSSGYGTASLRSRPSFLDTLGIQRVSSPPVLYAEPEKDKPLSVSTNLKTESAFSQQQPSLGSAFAEDSFNPEKLDFGRGKESLANSTILSNDESESKKTIEVYRNFQTPSKDEDFAALEQLIEDLTKEKFSLQRALDTAKSMAENLATENSSLTTDYNHQGQVINQLRTDMEKLQEEIKAQLLALESVQMEYVNAQLECNAADERAKILASEVINLEEKALRLRSNELKLEKQVEHLHSEISAYKRKVSILEKERQDFQYTIDALQEERKLLQSKLRKTSANEKVNDTSKVSTNKRDESTSTEDLEGSSLPETSSDAAPSMLEDVGPSVSSSANTTNISFLEDLSSGIPDDQIRMIDNINSLISELAVEREELMRALRIESSNCSKLKDLNKDLTRKLEAQTQRLELLTAQRMANDNALSKQMDTRFVNDTPVYADEGDEVVERVLGWIMKLFPGGPTKRRTSKLL